MTDSREVSGASASAPAAHESHPPPLTWQVAAVLAVLALVVVAVHWPALDAAAVSLDDEDYVGHNPLVTKPSWASVGRIFGEILHPSAIPAYYHPLPLISLMLDRMAGGTLDDTTIRGSESAHHLRPFRVTSLAFHTGTTVLAGVLLYLLFGQIAPAALIALLFGIHPLSVEEVVWLAQRKAVMAAFFAVAAMVFYVVFVQRRRRSWYAASLAAFVLALMSKPSSTPLPVLLVLLDFWPLRRLSWRTLREKIPFLAVGVPGALVLAYSHAATNFLEAPHSYAAGESLALLFYKLAFYAEKIAWPRDLSSFYAAPEILSFSDPMVRMGAVGTVAAAILCVASIRKLRALPTSLAFFFVCLFPALGVFRFSWIFVQDNYVYLPMVGLLFPLAALLTHIWSAQAGGSTVAVRALAAGLVLSAAAAEARTTRTYLAQWSDTLTLHRHMVALAPRAPQIRYNYGWALNDQGRPRDAEREFRAAIAAAPDYPRARHALGILLFESGRFSEAAEHLEVAARLTPDNARVHRMLGHTLLRLERPDRAVAEYRRAIAIAPDDVTSRVGLATALAALDQPDQAVKEIQRALQRDQRNADLYYFLGSYCERANRRDEAVDAYRRAVAIDPGHRRASEALAALLRQSPRIDRP